MATDFEKQDKEAMIKYFETLYHHNFERLFRYAFSIVLDKCLAEDIVSEVFMNFWNKKEQLGHVENMEAYLFSAVKNLSLRRISTDLFKRSLSTLDESYSAGNDDPELILLGHELEEIIEQVSARLSAHGRVVYDMAKNKGYSKEKIAQELGITIRAVDKHLHKIIAHFREALKVRFNDTNDHYFFMAKSIAWIAATLTAAQLLP